MMQLERVQVNATSGYILAMHVNAQTGQVLPPAHAGDDRLTEGTLVCVLNRDYQTSSTTFLRSFDGGRTWHAYQAQELLRTVRI